VRDPCPLSGVPGLFSPRPPAQCSPRIYRTADLLETDMLRSYRLAINRPYGLVICTEHGLPLTENWVAHCEREHHTKVTAAHITEVRELLQDIPRRQLPQDDTPLAGVLLVKGVLCPCGTFTTEKMRADHASRKHSRDAVKPVVVDAWAQRFEVCAKLHVVSAASLCLPGEPFSSPRTDVSAPQVTLPAEYITEHLQPQQLELPNVSLEAFLARGRAELDGDASRPSDKQATPIYLHTRWMDTFHELGCTAADAADVCDPPEAAPVKDAVTSFFAAKSEAHRRSTATSFVLPFSWPEAACCRTDLSFSRSLARALLPS
jgi:hypothetical protein